MRIVFLGPPGSGKGTQARLLADRLGVPAISTGEILRAAVQQGTPLGAKVKAVMEKGDLVSDDLMIELVRERIAAPDAARGFILDGFPRTVDQAVALEKILAGNEMALSTVVNLSVPEAALIDRLAGRAGQERRADDSRETVLERLRVYREKTEPLIGYYRRRNLITDVDGTGPVADVTEQIENRLRQAGSNRGVA